MSRFLFTGGKVIDPRAGKVRWADVLVEDGKVKAVGSRLKETRVQEIDCRNKFLAPGFIDLHCHLREPGEEIKETIASGCRAALASGFTQVCPMPNTIPPIDSEALIRFELAVAEAAGFARVIPVGCCTKGRQGRELAEFGVLRSAGARAVSDDGNWIDDAGLMRRVLEYAKTFDLVVMSHCEMTELVTGPADEGVIATRLGLPSAPAVAEAAAAARDILLAEFTNARLHICHVSSRTTVELIRWAKARGVPVTAETCPHYFTLTADCLTGFDTNYKVNPPLRTDADRKALIRALADGTIDAIATDHAPHTPDDKEKEFAAAASGIIGFETAFSLSYEMLVEKEKLSLPELIAKFTVMPATILGIDPPVIAPGAEANIVVLDTAAKWEFTPDKIFSRSYNTPFLGRKMRGRVVATLLKDHLFLNGQ